LRIALVVSVIPSLSVMLMGADPLVGTWKLDLEKSEPRRQIANIANEVRTISETGRNTFQTITDTKLRSGEVRHLEVSRVFDGREHFVIGYGSGGLRRTEVSTRVDEFTWRITQKRAGETIAEHILTVSSDGNVLTDHRTYHGETRLVFEKQ
jgi:hypothetical protein